MPRGPVSVQLYSVREQIAEDLEGTLARLASLGFQNVEPYGAFVTDRTSTPRRSRHRPRRAVRARGRARLSDPSPAFEAAAAIGVRTVIDPAHRTDDWESIDGIARIAERMNRASEQALEHGLTFGYHNHWWELEARPGGTPALELLAPRLDERIVLEVDTYWVEVGGVDVLGLLDRSATACLPARQGRPEDPRHEGAAARRRGRHGRPRRARRGPSAMRVLEFDDYEGDTVDGLAPPSPT